MKNTSQKSNTHRLPIHFWVGLLILLAGEVLLLTGSVFAATWFTPIMWSGYILAADGLVCRLSGSSWLTTRKREFPLLVLLSVGIWLLFEVYNLRLRNWHYLGLPGEPFLRDLGYFWSFATILPGVFVSSDLAKILLRRSKLRTHGKPVRLGPHWPWVLLGFAMVAIPPMTSVEVAPYLFAPVWIGFILLIDPINELMGTGSLRARLQSGDWTSVLALLIGGMACGFIWETWNYQAYLAQGAHWIYTMPDALRIFGLHFGKMPVLGLFGFPPFALELFVLYAFFRKVLNIDRILD
ncbi:MAG TPA: hypothetical protein G4O08_12135 [Anaerolineae bacterium]|nr:hypothetical protein [Anaerolineae bacterium]